jgi:hypothetical protein
MHHELCSTKTDTLLLPSKYEKKKTVAFLFWKLISWNSTFNNLYYTHHSESKKKREQGDIKITLKRLIQAYTCPQFCRTVVRLQSADIKHLWRKPVPVVGWRIVNVRAERNDSKGIDSGMTSIIMPLNMLHVNSATHARNLEDVFGVVEHIRVISEQLFVAFEVNCINLQ